MARAKSSANLTANNLIYLYRLLSQELGCGRQTFLPAVEEALASDQMTADDLGFDSTRDLLEALEVFVKLTIFKASCHPVFSLNPLQHRRALPLPDAPRRLSMTRQAARARHPTPVRHPTLSSRPAHPMRTQSLNSQQPGRRQRRVSTIRPPMAQGPRYRSPWSTTPTTGLTARRPSSHTPSRPHLPRCALRRPKAPFPHLPRTPRNSRRCPMSSKLRRSCRPPLPHNQASPPQQSPR